MRQTEGEILQDQYKQFPDEKFVGGYRMRQPYLLLRDLDLIKTVMVKDFDSFHDRRFPVDEKAMPLSAHVFNLKGRRWRALRAKMTPAFTSGKTRLMFQLMSDCGHALSRHLDAPAARGDAMEMREMLAQFATDVIGSCALGLQMHAMDDPDSEFRRVGRAVFEPTAANMARRLTLLFFPPLARALGLSFEGRRITDFFTRAVREMVRFREEEGVQRHDFIDLLLQLKRHGSVQEDKEAAGEDAQLLANAVHSGDDIQMTDNLLAAQVFVFFIAGFETSSTASSFALYEMALNPDVQERLRDEVDEAMADNGGHLTYDAIQNMRYLDMVWNESLRKYPPGNNLVRVVTRDYKMPGSDVQLPKGLWVNIPVMAIHHDPKYYPDPQRFDPERFSEEEKAKRPHYAFLPFGEGPRICIGMRFGILQGKLGLAMLLSKYRFSPCARTKVPLRFDPKSLVTASDDGIWLKIEAR
ncbi:hypothetical protein R5R35_005023 [Gryllus longicercus]